MTRLWPARPGVIGWLLSLALLTMTWIVRAPSVDAQDAVASPPPLEFPSLPPLPDATARTDGPLKVVATTPILADLARQIGGARLDVASILPPNADPHDLEPKPKDLVTVEGASLIVEHGLHLDAWASDLIKNAGSSAPTVIATTGVQTIASDEEGFADGDPHVWFDPRNVATMVDNIAAALVSIDPDGAASYEARRDAYKAQLDQLDQAIANQIATIPPERRKLVTNHDAFAYFVARYGLTFVGSVIPSLDSRAEPSAKDTAELIDKIKAEGVPAIFTESSNNPQLEEELAKEAGVKVVSNLYGDTLGEPGSGADTYIGMMETDTRLIVEALR
ncbi:MAG TPA: zinc ABC transporter substrate-binding protein [Thermomicrobiales bacterium]|jgi:zinc/manganese transport system substrate-binding protein/manganese/iron transport system substrate-binding protein